MAELHLWVPGAVVRPERYGPDWFQNMPDPSGDINWSDQQGVTTGFVTGYLMKAHKSIWFHFPFTVPTVDQFSSPQHNQLFLDRIFFLWSAGNNVQLRELTAHTGADDRFIAPVPGGAQAGDNRHGVTANNTYPLNRVNGHRPQIVNGLIVCARFECGERADGVGFSGMGVVLTDQED
jgi:hypothetical protein